MMIKLSSVENVGGVVWDHMGKSNLVQIFISYDDSGIYFVQFVYEEGGKFVLSERPAGTRSGSKFHTVSRFLQYYCYAPKIILNSWSKF